MSPEVEKQKPDKITYLAFIVAIVIMIGGPEMLGLMVGGQAGLLDYALFGALGGVAYWLILKICKKQPNKKQKSS